MYLLDTSIVSRLVWKQPDSVLLKNLRRIEAEELFISCICVMELRQGAAQRNDNGLLWSKIEKDILPRFQVLDFGFDEALMAGDLLTHLKLRGQPIGIEDVLIAATARTHGFTVVTNNVRHFRRVPELAVEDWTA